MDRQNETQISEFEFLDTLNSTCSVGFKNIEGKEYLQINLAKNDRIVFLTLSISLARDLDYLLDPELLFSGRWDKIETGIPSTVICDAKTAKSVLYNNYSELIEKNTKQSKTKPVILKATTDSNETLLGMVRTYFNTHFGPMSIQAVATDLHLHPKTVSNKIQKLFQKKFLTRTGRGLYQRANQVSNKLGHAEPPREEVKPPNTITGENVATCPACREQTLHLVGSIKRGANEEEIWKCKNQSCNYKGARE